ncbi:MAG: BspA family leucine-rich repeat surface protein, partial [Thaumarchaeota archaeon]|nr:BspA family leucine-rich repeat surface protein [Nitrososphaerota archaeon]
MSGIGLTSNGVIFVLGVVMLLATTCVPGMYDFDVYGQVNELPTVDAGTKQTVQEGKTVTLSGTASDADATDVLTYAWTSDVQGLVITGSDSLSASFTAPAVDVDTDITFTLSISDGTATVTDTVVISVQDYDPFITTWTVTSQNLGIIIHGTAAPGKTYTVDWGDGTTQSTAGTISHIYGSSGTYTVTISGDLSKINHTSHTDTATAKLASIEQWGDIEWSDMSGMFRGASNMVYNATDVPNLSEVTDMNNMFYNATSFNGDISDWDVSSVTNMDSMFYSATLFNGDISDWDVSKVTNMSQMFTRAVNFNQDISDWNVSSLENARYMFAVARLFNQDISSWDVSNVADMGFMFDRAVNFNQDISSWDVSGANTMRGMFFYTSVFNQDLSSWDVSNVTDMAYMFIGTQVFNQPLNNWDVSNVADMDRMFKDSSLFNQPLNNWDVSNVTDMDHMFNNSNSFNQPLNNWDVSNVKIMTKMFSNTQAFNQDISDWDVSNATNMTSMFDDAAVFSQNLGKWYIVLDDTSVDYTDASLIVGGISAQNSILVAQNPTYSIGTGGDSAYFEISGSNLKLKAKPTQASYDVTVNATGAFGTGNSESFTISVSNLPKKSGTNTAPTANAGNDQLVVLGSSVTLDGSGSTDPESDPLTYSWAKTSGPDVILTDATTATPSFTAPSSAGTIIF